MNYVYLKEQAKANISGNIGIFLLMYIVIYGISALLATIPAAGAVLCFAADSIFGISLILIFLALADGTQPQFMNLFDIFKNTRLCGNIIILDLLIALFTFLWSLLLIVPGIIKALSYSMAPFILAENDCLVSPTEALQESKRIMYGHKSDLFVLTLSFIGWWLLSIVTCGVALVYVLPYYQATLTEFYNSIKDGPQPAARPEING